MKIPGYDDTTMCPKCGTYTQAKIIRRGWRKCLGCDTEYRAARHVSLANVNKRTINKIRRVLGGGPYADSSRPVFQVKGSKAITPAGGKIEIHFDDTIFKI